MLQRNEVIKALADFLQPMKEVNAFWEGGSASWKRVDEWSDIDVQADVEDDKLPEVMKRVEKFLDEKFGIDLRFEIAQPAWPGMMQTFFRLKNSSPFMLIDFCLFKNSTEDKLLDLRIHGESIVHFDKKNIVTPSSISDEELNAKLAKRLELLKTRFEMYQVFTEKELNRGNAIEAFGYYLGFTVQPIVEVLRIQYVPHHWNFSFRYIHYELPEDVVKVVEPLYFVSGPEDLRQKWTAARDLFNRAWKQADAKIKSAVHV